VKNSREHVRSPVEYACYASRIHSSRQTKNNKAYPTRAYLGIFHIRCGVRVDTKDGDM